jgi:predicted DNA-binding transcriptional regulator AlpA
MYYHSFHESYLTSWDDAGVSDSPKQVSTELNPPERLIATARASLSEDRLLDLTEVAEVLGHISTRSVRRLIARGDLPPPIKILSTPRLYHSEVMAFLERLKQKRNQSLRKQKGLL